MKLQPYQGTAIISYIFCLRLLKNFKTVSFILLLLVSLSGTSAFADRPALPPGYSSKNIHVKLEQGIDVDLFETLLPFNLRNQRHRIRKLFSLSESELNEIKTKGERRSGKTLPNMQQWFQITLKPDSDAAVFIEELRKLDSVAIAEAAPLPPPPPAITPDFIENQGYLDAATDGIDARYSWTIPGGNGNGITIFDIEYSWNQNHEDLSKANGISLLLDTNDSASDPYSDYNHGTAVLGEIIADNNSMGVTGISWGADIGLAPAYTTNLEYNPANAILLAVAAGSVGDVILIEQQFWVCDTNNLGPSEWLSSVFDAIQTAVANGLVVIEAAGNGGVDLDQEACGTAFQRTVQDSGAIIVGAGGIPGGDFDRQRLSSSSYGSRVDVQGWGNNVATTGYGHGYMDPDNPDNPNSWYSFTFNGTSSAAAIVAGAVANLQGIMLDRFGSPLSPVQIRNLLVRTGSPQLGNTAEHIGPRPNLQKAIAFLEVERALHWLWNQQSNNGSWQNHVGYTAMASLAFQNAGYTEDDGVVSDGIQYLLSNIQPDGGIYSSYGNYETSLSILALKATGNPDHNDEIASAANYLKSIQSDDSDNSAHSWYGGWGYSVWDKNNWSDLSNSQFSAMALDAAGVPKNDIVWTRFLRYLSRVQNLDDINDMPWANGRADGGFTYSPHYNIWNNFNSYGSMTGAGLWGLRLSGVEVADNRVQAALGWLEANEDLNFNSNPMWGNSTRYYYYMAFAKAMAMCFLSQDDTGAWYEGWYDNLKSKIASEQHEDGYWNQSQGMWVDTFWALLTLQTQQPLPANLWMSVVLASPADLIVYDPQDRVCDNHECNIPGAEFFTENGEQIVNLTQLEPGHYRFVFIGTDDGTVHLTVNGHRDEEVISTETEEFEIRNNEILQSDVLVSSLVGALTITVEDPEPPPFIHVGVDICPEECPNNLFIQSKGTMPLVVLGTDDFDATLIDPATVYLALPSKELFPKRWNWEDVSGPHGCDCGLECEAPDGRADLTLKFDRRQLIPALGDVNIGDTIELILKGNLKPEFGGTPIQGTDTVIISE